MPLDDKLAAAKRVASLLDSVLRNGGFRLKYRIQVNPPRPAEARDWEYPEIEVHFSGPDAPQLIANNGELLRSLEHLSHKLLRLEPEELDKVIFDALNYRANRLEELRLAAEVAAERVRSSGAPYEFSPMSSRERRLIHLALRDQADLRTESAGEAGQRHVVLYPKDYKGQLRPASVMRRRR